MPLASLIARLLALVALVLLVSCEAGGAPVATQDRLSVVVDGEGRVTSDGGEIDCSENCVVEVERGQTLVLNAQAADGWRFEEWRGACAGASCRLVTTGPATVRAVFSRTESPSPPGGGDGPEDPVDEPPPAGSYRLSVGKTGSGRGVVTSEPAGITCGDDCSERFPEATTVTLVARPAAQSELAEWSGCDTVDGTSCVVEMTEERSVSVTFAEVLEPADPEPFVLRADDPHPGDGFGRAIAIDGTTLAVTQITAELEGPEEWAEYSIFTGTVHLYELIDGQWVRQQSLTAPNELPRDPWMRGSTDNFGGRLALQGDTLVVSSPPWVHYASDTWQRIGSSSVAVYERDASGTWQFAQVMQHGNWFHAFGDSISIDGETLIVGKYGDIDDGNPMGSVVWYERVNNEWEFHSEFTPYPSDASFEYRSVNNVQVIGDHFAFGHLSETYLYGRQARTSFSHRLTHSAPFRVLVDGFIAAGTVLHRLVDGDLVPHTILEDGPGLDASGRDAFLFGGNLYEQRDGTWMVTRGFGNEYVAAAVSQQHVAFVRSRGPDGQPGEVMIYPR